MKKILFLLLMTTSVFAQLPSKFDKIKVVNATKKNDATRVIVQDSITKEYHWVLKSTVGTGTVTSVTGTDGITVANGTTTPVIGINTIAQSKVTGLISDLANKANDNSVVHLSGNETITSTKTIDNILIAEQPISSIAYKIGQTVGTNDFWNIYGKSDLLDRSEVIFEVGDNGSPYASNGQRFRFHYNADFDGTEKDPLIIDYENITANANITAPSFIKNGGSSSQFLKADGSIDNSTYQSLLIPNETNLASGTYEGKLRYYVSGNNSYIDLCMKTGSSTYEWVNIVQNNW